MARDKLWGSTARWSRELNWLSCGAVRVLACDTTGSVEFYSTYPGMYVPRPLGLRPSRLTLSPRELGTEILALSKMNWNQSRLDARPLITLKTTDQVEQILRFCVSAIMKLSSAGRAAIT
jgi:hypothetical protein